MLSRSFMLIILSVVQSVLVPFLILQGSLLNMSGLLVKMCLVVREGGFGFLFLPLRMMTGPVDFSGCWTPPDYWDADDIALEMSDHSNVWTGGSREDFSSVGGFEVAGAGVHLLASEIAF